jgi:hypothetical protein
MSKDEKINELIEAVKSLRQIILQFRQSIFFLDNEKFYVSILANVEIAICLTEKVLLDNRPININENYWFQGDRFVQDAFNLREGNEYYEIYIKYRLIGDNLKSLNYLK